MIVGGLLCLISQHTKWSFYFEFVLVDPYHQVSSPWEFLSLWERPFATDLPLPDYILMITLGKVMVTSKHIVNSSASTHDQQSKWSKGHQPYAVTRHDPIWHAGMIWWAVPDTRSISQWNIDSEQRKPPCCCSKAVPTSDGGDPTIPSSDHMS